MAYGVVVVLLYPLRRSYWQLLEIGGEWIYNLLFASHPVDLVREGWAILVQPAGRRWNVGLCVPAISASLISANVPLTLALICATPGPSLSRRLKILGWCGAALLGTHLINMLVEIRMDYLGFYAAKEGIRVGGLETRLVRWAYGFFQYFRAQLIPFLLWAAFCYRDLLTGGGWNASSGEPGRNQPCPCGSGKKFKHCCGKTTSSRTTP